MHRPVVIAGVLALVPALVLGAPAAAGAEPSVPDGDPSKSVLSVDAGGAVFDIDLSTAVMPLEEEKDDGSRVTVRISADVLFDFGKSTLTDTARRRIAGIAPRLRGVKGTVQVSGHSDSIGDPGYNLTLSEQRAEAVRTELRGALNGAGPRLQAKGYGEARPIAPNERGGKDDPLGRAKNRRVEITYAKG